MIYTSVGARPCGSFAKRHDAYHAEGAREADSLSTLDLASLTETLLDFFLKGFKRGWFEPSGVVQGLLESEDTHRP